MKLTEDVEAVTLDGLRRFIEQAERNGAPGDTAVQMTSRRNRDVVTLTVEFTPGEQTRFTTTRSESYPSYPLGDVHSRKQVDSVTVDEERA